VSTAVLLLGVMRDPSLPGKVGAEHLDIEILDWADSGYLDVEILEMEEAV
jgi:hypothetical protein